jgi:hypothetical protein
LSQVELQDQPSDDFLFWTDYSNYVSLGYVELLEHFYRGSEFIWIQLELEFGKDEKHANQLIVELPKDSNVVSIMIYEPWFEPKSTFERNERNVFHKKLNNSIRRFFSTMTGRTEIKVERKHIPEVGCLFKKGLQNVVDLEKGICLIFSQFMTVFYLVNKKNPTLENDEEIRCILTALQGNVLKIMSFYVYYLITFSDSKSFKSKMKRQLQIVSERIPNLKILLESPPSELVLKLESKLRLF